MRLVEKACGTIVSREKDSLRSSFKSQLNELSTEDKRAQSAALRQKLSDFLNNQEGVWTLFAPLNDEPNIMGLLESSTHIDWSFPRVESKEDMRFFRVSTPDELVTSSWGLEEPPANPQRCVDKQELQGCLVPGLAFDRQGTRLGRGGGFYDRFLQNFKGLKLGVTFRQGLTDETLPRESHDQKMDMIISPDSWIDVDRSEV